MPQPRRPVATVPEKVTVDAQAGADRLAIARAMHERGQLDQAEALYREILRSQPRHFDAMRLLATIAAQRKHSATAVELFEQVLAIDPDHAVALNHCGNALLDLRRHADALAHYDRALTIAPGYAEAHYNRGNALLDLERHADALESYDRALAIEPRYVEAHYNRGSALRHLARHEDALESYDRTLAIEPDHADALCNRGNALLALNRHVEALQSYDRALTIAPDYADVHMNRALTWLTLGDFERGWPEHEWRWKYAGLSLPPMPKPRWSSEPLSGRTILLRWEQGLGDTIHFARYARILQRQGARVVVSCQPPLLRLLQRCEGIDALVAHGDPLPDHDFWTPLMSVAGHLPTDHASIPGECGYLTADPALVARWKARLAAYPGFRIAIAWQGNPGHRGDRQRSIPLERFGQLANVPGVRLISVQTGPGVEQLADATRSFEVIRFADLDTTSGPFMDTAAIMQTVDLTVGCDSSAVHLAGALGTPVWLARMFSADWRWLVDRNDSPWYPSMRLFRQRSPNDWDELFGRMARALRARLDTRDVAATGGAITTLAHRVEPMHIAATISVEVSPGELIDKITILEIKSERIAAGRRVDRQDREIKADIIPDADKLHNVHTELATHVDSRDRSIPPSSALAALTAELKAVNEDLWHVEDQLRDCERQKDFGAPFVELARSVYKTNDRRWAIKRQINTLLGSRLLEEKLYAPY